MQEKTPKEILTQSYEDLRDSILRHKMALMSPRGLTLFLRQGMAGWIEAWSRPVLSNPVMTISPQPMKIDSRDVVPTPSETATILANMALAAIRRNNP
jgi:hypothetical protein